METRGPSADSLSAADIARTWSERFSRRGLRSVFGHSSGPLLPTETFTSLILLVFALLVAWQVGGRIASGDNKTLIYIAIGFVGCVTAVTILRNWRLGTFILIAWLIFEDLLRKYMGNGVALFFGKDILAALIYLSFYAELRRGKVKLFRPPFAFLLTVFFWLGVVQVFNLNSPSIWYGLLGIKVYFFYIPLMFVSYALIRSDEDLRKFLSWNLLLGAAVAAVGIAQAILGNSFMNPENLAVELRDLGDLSKINSTGEVFNLPPSVFVSSSRYAQFLVVAIILALGTVGYLLLTGKRGRTVAYITTAMLGAATLLCASKGAFLWVFGSAVLLPVVFLWGAPWRARQVHRIVKAMSWSAALFCLGLLLVFWIFPAQVGLRMQYYTDTLLPSGSSYALSFRSWQYPIENLMQAFTNPNWVFGNGIGTGSLGAQYVPAITGRPQPIIWVEEGYGVMILEMGIVAPFLWIAWTASLLYHSWKVVWPLRQTRYFPLAFAIFWYAFILLYPYTYEGLGNYQNYVTNAYLWLFMGVLFRLPELNQEAAVDKIDKLARVPPSPDS